LLLSLVALRAPLEKNWKKKLMLYISTFKEINQAYQVYLSLVVELEFCRHFENLILITEEGISKLKTICSEIGIGCKVDKNYCLLPFPKEEREYTESNSPAIYVACLAAYNNSYLHGMWLDADRDYEEVQEDINWMLSWSPVRDIEECEEWAIHDYENFEGIELSEYEDIETVCRLANAISEHGKAFALFYDAECLDDIDEAIDKFQDAYYGEYKSEEDFAYELVEQCGWLDNKNPLHNYIDYERYARDLELSGDFYYIQCGFEEVHVFSNY